MMSILSNLTLAGNGSAVVEILAKVTAVLAVALVTTRLAHRSSAAIRHVVLAAAFAVLLVLPVASILVPVIPIVVPVAVQERVAWYSVERSASDVSPTSTVTAGVAAGTIDAEPRRLPLSALLFAGWMIISIVYLLSIGSGLWQMRTLRKAGIPWPDGQSILDALAAEAGMHRRIAVLLNEAVAGPMTCGVVRPAVLLPANATSWPEEDLRRALTHEIEHVRRFDWLTQCFMQVACACYCFHPLVWIARRRLVLEAERACDDAVLRRADATAYAAQLVGLAERLSRTSKRPLVAMANPGDLTMRVRAILDHRQRRTRIGTLRLAVVSGAATLLLLVVSGIEIITLGHVEPAPPQGNAASGARLQFAAASLRTLPPAVSPTRVRCMGTDGELFPMPSLDPAPIARGRCTAARAFVETLVATAYASSGYASTATYRVVGVPASLQSPLGYEIQATAEDPSRVTKAELQQMLQTLLTDRFNAKIHRETREMDGFVMTVAKSGIKFKVASGTPDVPRLVIPTGIPNDRIPAGLTRAASGPPGGMLPLIMKGNFSLAAVTTTVVELLGGAPVIDKTGLPDLYDITLNLEQFAPRQQVEGVRGRPLDGELPRPEFSPSLIKAMEDQLGLHFEAAKVPVDFVIVDHIEKASEN